MGEVSENSELSSVRTRDRESKARVPRVTENLLSMLVESKKNTCTETYMR